MYFIIMYLFSLFNFLYLIIYIVYGFYILIKVDHAKHECERGK
jgi:predicted membrane protein